MKRLLLPLLLIAATRASAQQHNTDSLLHVINIQKVIIEQLDSELEHSMQLLEIFDDFYMHGSSANLTKFIQRLKERWRPKDWEIHIQTSSRYFPRLTRP